MASQGYWPRAMSDTMIQLRHRWLADEGGERHGRQEAEKVYLTSGMAHELMGTDYSGYDRPSFIPYSLTTRPAIEIYREVVGSEAAYDNVDEVMWKLTEIWDWAARQAFRKTLLTRAFILVMEEWFSKRTKEGKL